MRKTVLALACTLMLAGTTNAADSYEVAYKATQETGKPLVVLIGADWCPACQVMKNSVMPKLENGGKLKDVSFAVVNTDRQDRIARAMMEGNLIPQLVVYTKTSDGWKMNRLVGGQSAEAVEKFLADNAKKSTTVEVVQRQK